MQLKAKILPIILLLFTLINSIYANPSLITDYRPTFIPCFNKQGDLNIAIRMYYVDTEPYFLTVNPYTFTTQKAPIKDFTSRQIIISGQLNYYTMKELQSTPYMKAITRYTSWPYKLQNAGITHAEYPTDGMFLTIDMCPSSKPVFEEKFFNMLVIIAKQSHQPVPIAISMTGLWLLAHETEFNWLIDQEKAGTLKITWINHTFSHVYYRDLPFDKNFLLTPQTDFSDEVLALEKILIEHGQTPSVFFRFPGLISNKELILQLRKLNLIPIGTNAWLARGQKAEKGSIILVHGNSNEPEGITLVMPLLQNKNLLLLPLSQAFLPH